jgi:hypothetical protein
MKCIINARKAGEPPSHLFRIKNNSTNYMDEMINFHYVLRVCQEAGHPFTMQEIIRQFDEIYQKKYHGSRNASLNWIKQYLIPPTSNTFLHESSKKLDDSRPVKSKSEEILA